jgi:amidase
MIRWLLKSLRSLFALVPIYSLPLKSIRRRGRSADARLPEGQIQTQKDLVTNSIGAVNPATGPVYLRHKPGDILKVDLLDIQVGDQSSMVTIPGEGALGDVITEMETAILRREGNELVFKDKIRIPTRPMIGVIGVAPESGAVPNGTPGPHGGNMDCTLIAQGNSVYFTVGVDGALFWRWRLHAAMGDGEIVVAAQRRLPGSF